MFSQFLECLSIAKCFLFRAHFSLIRDGPIYSILLFWPKLCGDIKKKITAKANGKELFPCSLPEVLWSQGLIFGSFFNLSRFFSVALSTPFHFDMCGNPVLIASFIKETVLCLLWPLGVLVKNQFVMYAWIYFCDFYFPFRWSVSPFKVVLYCLYTIA